MRDRWTLVFNVTHAYLSIGTGRIRGLEGKHDPVLRLHGLLDHNLAD